MDFSKMTKRQLIDEIKDLNEKVSLLEKSQKKVNDNELNNCKEKYRLLFLRTNDLIFLHPFKTEGQPAAFYDINEKACEVLEYSREELLTKTPLDIIEVDEQDIKKEAGLLSEKKSLIFEKVLIAKSGKKIPVEISTTIFKHDGIPTALSVARDITERKKSEKKINRQNSFLKLVIDSIPHLIFVKDQTGRFILVNEALAETYNTTTFELIGKTDADLLNNVEEAKKIRKDDIKVLETLQCMIIPEERITDFDGNVRWYRTVKCPVIEGNKADKLLGITIDITENKKAEERIKFLSSITENITDSILVTDLSHNITYINRAAEKLFGFRLKELKGKTPDILNAEATAPEIQQKIYRNVSDGKTYFGENLGKRKNGSSFYCEYKVMPLKNSEGNIYSYVGIQRDITERKKAEESLCESEEKFRLSFENANIGMCLVDLSGILFKVNDKMTEIFGYSKQELEGITVNDIAHDEDKNKSPEFIKKSIKGDIISTEFEKRYYHKNGSIIHCFISSSLVRDKDNNPKYFISQVQDITQRKKAEEALRESEKRYRLLFDSIGDAVLITDSKSKFLDCNKAALKRYGYTRKNFLQMKGDDIVHPDYLRLMKENLKKISLGKQVMVESVHLSKKVNAIPVEINSRFIEYENSPAILSVIRDISVRKKAENSLKESEEKYRSLTENLNVGVYRSSPGPKGRFIEVNTVMYRMLGFESKEEFINLNVSDIYRNPEDRAEFNEKMKKYGAAINEELRLKKKDGTPIIVSDTCTAVKDGNRKILYFDGVMEDITERKNMEMMLLRSEKMASIGTLAAGVAHEINNPIGYISNNLRMMERYSVKLNDFYRELDNQISVKSQKQKLNNLSEQYDINFCLEDLKDALSESIEGAGKVKRIVSDLRDFSRSEKQEIKLTNLNEEIEKTVNILANELKYKAELEKDFGDIPKIECDPVRLNQVFINILINSIQAIEDRGKIKIKTWKVNESILIQFSDSGIGISPENIGKIFDAFYTTKDPGKGTGLGLAVSYKIIQEHNGIINVESEVGKGTTFTIQLPVKLKDRIKKYKILIIDDEKDFRISLKSMIAHFKPACLIQEAKDGFEAGDKYSEFKPDLVFLDIKMPGINGIEVCRKIKSAPGGKDTKIILITGFGTENLKKKSFEAGASEFLNKPVNLKVIKKVLDRFLYK